MTLKHILVHALLKVEVQRQITGALVIKVHAKSSNKHRLVSSTEKLIQLIDDLHYEKYMSIHKLLPASMQNTWIHFSPW